MFNAGWTANELSLDCRKALLEKWVLRGLFHGANVAGA